MSNKSKNKSAGRQPQLAEQANPELVQQLLNQTQGITPPKQETKRQPKKEQPKKEQPQRNQRKAQNQQPKRQSARKEQPKKEQPKEQPKNETAKKEQPQSRQQGQQKSAARPKNQPRRSRTQQARQRPAQRNPRGQQRQGRQPRRRSQQDTLKIIPLGGLSEIGKNITYYEYGGDALLIDCGIAFPDESMPGIDIVIPDFTYVVENQNKIRGLCLTHGHEDHIGSIPYLLKHFNVPIYGTRLTLGLVEGKLKEHGLLRNAKLNPVKAGDTVELGQMSAEFINVNHSIPDACSIAVHTPAGIVIQTGDFKIDFTPIAGEVINLARFGELGSKGVLALLADSTNAERPGFAESEAVVGTGIDNLFNEARDKRIIVATFASNVHRIQQLIDAAIKYDRKVAVSGRSMETVSAKAMELGYLNAPKDILIDVHEAEKLPPGKVAVITTGSQGEPMSALTRMARGDHRQLRVTKDDVIILSANPIPGNEKAITGVVNDLMRIGAHVFYDSSRKLHVSGHACQDELRLILALTKPKYFVPVHGERKHLQRHAELALGMGIPEERIFIGDNGQVMEISDKGVRHNQSVPSGQVLVDGLGVGDVGTIVLRDRKRLAEDGLIVVIATLQKGTGKILTGPDIVSRGFVYVRESEDIISKARSIAQKSMENCVKQGNRDWNSLKRAVQNDVGDYVWQTTKRRPMILPVIQEVR